MSATSADSCQNVVRDFAIAQRVTDRGLGTAGGAAAANAPLGARFGMRLPEGAAPADQQRLAEQRGIVGTCSVRLPRHQLGLLAHHQSADGWTSWHRWKRVEMSQFKSKKGGRKNRKVSDLPGFHLCVHISDPQTFFLWIFVQVHIVQISFRCGNGPFAISVLEP